MKLINLFPLSTQLGKLVITIAAIIIAGFVISLVLGKILQLFFDGLRFKSTRLSHQKRIDTLRTLLANVSSVAIATVIFLIILKDIGVDITPILTGAGILGLAISFGAQTLVKDLISGFFILVENQYNVGDTVKIADIKGMVRRINLRTTVLKDEEANRFYIPNSEIKTVKVYKKAAQPSHE